MGTFQALAGEKHGRHEYQFFEGEEAKGGFVAHSAGGPQSTGCNFLALVRALVTLCLFLLLISASFAQIGERHRTF